MKQVLAMGVALLVMVSGPLHAAPPATPSHGLSVYGDLKYPPDFTHFEYADPNAPKGGTITLAGRSTYDSLNPFVLKGLKAVGSTLPFDTLLTQSADEPFSEYGLLAESVELAPDRSHVIFNLRTEARFHDGTPVTADDVVFTFKTLIEKGHPFYANYYKDVTGVERLSATRVKFTFADKTNRELPLIVGQLPVLSKAFFDTHPFEETTQTPILGSGPYKIASFETGRRIVYERVKDYWAADLPVNRGRYNADRLVYDYYRDETVAIEALKAGEYDFRQENISKIWANDYQGPVFDKGLMVKEEIAHQEPAGMQAFVMNTRRDKFKDRRTRLALNYAFDFEWSNKNLFYGAYKRNYSYFTNSDYAGRGLPSEAELALLEPWRGQVPEEVFTTEYNPITTDGSGNNRQQMLIARDLLQEAGWELREDKWLYDPQTGKRFEIEFLIYSPLFERVIAPLVRNLKQLGIESRIRKVDASQFQKRLEEFDYDIVIYWFTQSPSPGNEQLDYWHSSRADVEGSKNFIGVQDPAVDALVERLVQSASREELITAARALDRVLLWQHYVIPNWHNNTYRVAYWDRFGRPEVNPPYALGFPHLWWVEAEKDARIAAARKGRDSASQRKEGEGRASLPWIPMVAGLALIMVLIARMLFGKRRKRR